MMPITKEKILVVEDDQRLCRLISRYLERANYLVNTVNNANLNYPSFDGHGYTVFGKVISGMEVVEEIENSATATKMTPHGPMQDWPTVDVVIVKATMK